MRKFAFILQNNKPIYSVLTSIQNMRLSVHNKKKIEKLISIAKLVD